VSYLLSSLAVMRKAFFRISVCLSAFLLGVFASSIPSPSCRAVAAGGQVRGETGRDVVPVSGLHTFRVSLNADFSDGFEQGWRTEDGQVVFEGSHSTKSKKSGTLVHQLVPSGIVREYAREFRDSTGRVGERYLVERKPDTPSGLAVTIVYYHGESYSFIEATTKELAVEFEQRQLAMSLDR
jgi:hypothetical protein